MVKVQAGTIHAHLVYLKDKSGMTIQDISRASGVPRSTVQRILTADDPHTSVVYILAVARSMGGNLWLQHPFAPEGGIVQQPEQQTPTEAILRDYGATVQRMSSIIQKQHKSMHRLFVALCAVALVDFIQLVLLFVLR